MGNLDKIRVFTYEMQHNEWDITKNFKNVTINLEKCVFHWEK